MEIEHYLSSGWSIKTETDTHYILTKGGNSGVHLILALFFWWLIFIPNMIYALMAHKQMIVKKDKKKK